MDFDLARPANPSSILCGRRAVLSRLRQLETITLNQQTPAYFHHTKEPCAHSAHYLPTAGCVFVCVVEMPQQFSPSLPDLSPHFQTFFSAPSIFLFFLLSCASTDCSLGPDRAKEGSQAAARA